MAIALPTTGKQPSYLKLTIMLGILSAFGPLSIDMYLPGLPAITRDFQSSSAATQLTLSIFFIGLAFGQAFYGPLSDRYGRRIPLLIGCTIYALASLGCIFAPSIEWLIALRFAQAIGGCAGMVISRSVVRDLFEAREAARMFSFLMLVMGLAPITAPLIGGQLLVFFGWRAIFWLLAGFGLLCVGLVATQLPETLPSERRVAAGISQALQIYARLASDRQFIGYAITGALISAGMFAYIAGSPFVVIEYYHVSPQQYGFIFGANALGLIIASQVNRRMLEHWRNETILLATLITVAVAGLVLLLVAATDLGGLPLLLLPLFFCIASVGIVQPNTSAAAMAPYGKNAGSASALLGVIQFGAGTIASGLVGAISSGNAFGMAAIMTCCGISALVVFQSLANRRLPVTAS